MAFYIRYREKLTSLFSQVRKQFLWPEIGFAVLSLMPVFLCAWLFNDILFLKVGLISISLFIAINRLKYGFSILTLHYCLILLGFSLLYLSMQYLTMLFVFLCAFIALLCIFLTSIGDKLRTFGNYTFIPSVYLACEIYYISPQKAWLDEYWKFLAMTPIAWLTIAVFYLFFYKAQFAHHRKSIFPDKGIPLKNWLPSGIAIFLGVFCSALLGILLHLDSPEWLIWSTASVITTELTFSRNKFLQRLTGAILGVIIGFYFGRLLPQTELTYTLAVLGIMLSLTSFKDYFISFSCRCFFIALAAYAISNSEHIAMLRVQNVLIGGLIGLFFLYLTHYLLKWLNINL